MRSVVSIPVATLSTILFAMCIVVVPFPLCVQAPVTTNSRAAQSTCFQNAEGFDPHYNIRADVAIAYGVSDTLTSRIQGWAARGYVPHLMTGAAWGEYEE